MENAKRWARPGWPWELEAVTLLFMLCALVLPLLVTGRVAPHQTELSQLNAPLVVDWSQSNQYLWTFIILATYVAHLLVANLAIDYVSTPFTHMTSPVIFAGMGYARLALMHHGGVMPLLAVRQTAGEIIVFVLTVTAMTFLLARLRMKRHMRRFEGMAWDISERPHVDGSLIPQILLRIRPLFYLPNAYRACRDGLLVEGWNYVMPIPMHEIQSVVESREGDFTSSGFYAATSSHELIRLELRDSTVPIFISPRNSYRFLQYLEKQLYGRAHVDPWREAESQSDAGVKPDKGDRVVPTPPAKA